MKRKEKTAYERLRKPVPPPTQWHKDKSKYSRKRKHKKPLDKQG